MFLLIETESVNEIFRINTKKKYFTKNELLHSGGVKLVITGESSNLPSIWISCFIFTEKIVYL